MDELLVRGTAWLSFVFYCSSILMQLYGKAWPWARLLWNFAALVFAIHVTLAFHLVHRWSHDAAWQATKKQGGVGKGIYLNYLLLALWLLDAIWWSIRPQSYLHRSQWITLSLHLFFLFMWFNAAVIFAIGPMRWLGVAGFLTLSLTYYISLRNKPTHIKK
ncbi:MAG: hypothetical protein JNJ77_12360 [Planctomycetia bacterium]|nr:hypothetical protein [Planctomycetia bacterium]